MTGATHSTVGALVGAAIGFRTGNPWVGITMGAFGALLPDIDDTHTILGSVAYPVSYATNKLVGHRTYTHTLWFVIIVAMLVQWLSSAYIVPYLHVVYLKDYFITTTAATITWPLIGGMVSHLALDSMTKTGIYPLLPIRWSLHGPVVTGSYVDYGIATGCALLLVGWIGITFLK